MHSVIIYKVPSLCQTCVCAGTNEMLSFCGASDSNKVHCSRWQRRVQSPGLGEQRGVQQRRSLGGGAVALALLIQERTRWGALRLADSNAGFFHFSGLHGSWAAFT